MICDVKLSGKPTYIAGLEHMPSSHNVRFELGFPWSCIAFELPYFAFWHRFHFRLWSDRNGKFWPAATFHEAA